jgi:hypothetical protein
LIARFFIETLNSYSKVLQHIIPILQQLLNDKEEEVKAASEGIEQIVNILKPEDRGDYILTLVLTLAHDEDEGHKTLALDLLSILSQYIEMELCENFIAREVESLADETEFKIRKAVASVLGNLSQRLSKQGFKNRILPIYYKLSKDKVWGIRRCCAENWIHIAKLCEPEVVKENLLVLYNDFLKDKSRWVKQTAMQHLGRILAEMPKELLPDEFLKSYISMATSSNDSSELSYYCAYYFPGVLMNLGPEIWNDMNVKKSYGRLANNTDIRVRKCIASSFHEVCKLVPPELCTKEMIPLYVLFLNEVSALKTIALGSLSKVLPCISEKDRDFVFDHLREIQADAENWRLREILGSELKYFKDLFSKETLHKQVWPIAYALAQDKCSTVRETSAISLGAISNSLLSYDQVRDDLAKFAVGTSYNTRIVFALMCMELTDKNVEQYFATELSNLCEDKVANVRIAVGDAVKTKLTGKISDPYWLSLAEKLKVDSDADVRYSILGKYDTDRGLKSLIPQSVGFKLSPVIKRSLSAEDDSEMIVFTSKLDGAIQVLTEEMELDSKGLPVFKLENYSLEEFYLDHTC